MRIDDDAIKIIAVTISSTTPIIILVLFIAYRIKIIKFAIGMKYNIPFDIFFRTLMAKVTLCSLL